MIRKKSIYLLSCTLPLISILLLSAVNVCIADEIIIGTGNTVDQSLPFEYWFGNYNYSQQIYLQTDIDAGGTFSIDSIAFEYNGEDANTKNPIVVYMAHTSKASFSSTSDWVAVGGLTQVYSGTYSVTTTAGWHTITLDTPFEYNNSDNLLLVVDDNSGNSGSFTDNDFYCTNQGSNRSIQTENSSNINPASPPNGTLRSYCANLKLSGTVSGLPTITTHPQSDTVNQGDPVTFVVDAIGSPPISYKWQKDGSDITGATDSTYSISPVDSSDAGDYRCIAANSFGFCTTTVANLVVYNLVITEHPQNQTVLEGGTANFKITADGYPSPVNYQWQRDDGGWHDISPGGDSDTLSFVTVAGDDGVHFRCGVSNAFMSVTSDSATLTVSDYYNPFKVKAEYYNSTQVRIKIWSDDDISGFPSTTHPFDPWADSVWVMYKTSGYASTVSEATVTMYSTEAVKQAAPDSLKVTLTVGQLPVPNDSCFWFNYSVLWHIPSAPDSLLQPYIQANKVMMVDTGTPNPLVLYGEYIDRTDTALIIIDSITELQTKDSLVVVQVSELPDFTTLRLDDTLTVTDLMASGEKDTIIMDNVAPLPIPLDTLYIKWFIIVKSQAQSLPRATSFEIGWPRPVYTGTLTADSIAWLNDRMKLSWDAPQAGTDTVRIWWNTDPIPLSYDPGLNINQAFYPNAGVTLDTLYNLLPATLYYFGLQIFDDSLWSVITALSSDTMQTPVGDTTIPDNTIKIDSSKFNTTTNSIELYWHANLNQQPPEDGYRFSYTAHPGLPLNLSITPIIWDTIAQEFNMTGIPLESDIVFDTSYAAGLWIRGVHSDGSSTVPASPKDSSTDTIQIPSFTWQIIHIFPVDTVYAANQKIICIKHNDPMDITDTVWGYQYPDPIPKGFVDVGSIPLTFDPWEQQPASFKLGLKYGSLPFRVSESDLALYQVKNNEFHVFYDSEVSNGTVWAIVDKDDMPYPLIVLADTIKPAISVRPHNDTITKGNDYRTYFSTVDDVANLHWEFIYGPGNEGYSYGSEAYLNKSNDTTSRFVPIKDTDNVIHEKFGVRALVIADDGVRADTVNVSRRVKSSNCEYFSLTAKNWAPLRTTKDVAQTELAEVFGRSTSVRKEWEYDIYKYRLYRWYDTDPQKVNSWLEYSDNVKDEFDFVPSRLIWCKTAEDLSIDFGEGVTTSLKESYEIALKPDNWTDITMPFEFEVMLRDALEASGTIHDSLEVYQWIKDGNKYGYRDLFIYAFDSLTNEKDTMTADQKNGGCTVFNHYSSEVKLLIPPISLPLSKYTSTATRQPEKNSRAWDISLRWKNSLAGEQQFIKRVRCGYKQGDAETIFGMLPPSMSSVLVGVLDSSSNRICGWALKRSLDNNGGVSFDICFRNYSDNSAKVEYYLDNLGILPDGFNAKLFNSKTMEYEECTADNIASIDLSPDAGASRILAIGSGNYFNYLISAFLPMKILKAYPNPFNSMVKINYRIPAGIKEVRFNIYNLQGKLLWNGRDHKNVTIGEHTFFFDSNKTGRGKLPNGVYILRLSAKNSSGKTIYGGEKRITCIK